MLVAAVMKSSKKKKKKAPQRKEVTTPQETPGSKRKYFFAPVICILLLAGITAYFLRSRDMISAGAYKGFNVLLVTLDTVRADHLRQYGYTKIKTPNLDQLSTESFIFRDAISHVPLTLPSHASILTGRRPRTLGIFDNSGFYLNPKEITLAEILKANGYETAAFVSSVVLDSQWGLNQGFDDYYDNFSIAEFKELDPHHAQRPGGETERETELWLDAHHQKKFFCWVHFYDPHEPYAPPGEYQEEYRDRPYDGEIAYTDENIGRLVRKLASLGVDRNTMIVVTSDHGEGLGEHRELTHSTFLYNTTQHVPLIIRIPGARTHQVPGVVRLIDVAPTILDLVAVQRPDQMQGSSLIAMMNGREKQKRVAYSESAYAKLHYGWSPLKSITREDYKFIEAPKPELYDRQADPAEEHNLIAVKPEVAKSLKSELDRIIQSSGALEEKTPGPVDTSIQEKLRSLGYLTGVSQSTAMPGIDPKDKIQVINGMQQALSAVQRGHYETSVEIIHSVLKDSPELIDAHFTLAAASSALHMYDDAVREYQATIALRPDYTEARSALAECYIAQEKFEEAEGALLKVLEYSPEDLYVNLRLARLYFHHNQTEKAKLYFARTIDGFQKFLRQTRKDEAKATLHSTLGDIYIGMGDLERAEENYSAAIAIAPTRPAIHFAIGQIHERKHDLSGAIAEYKKELEVAPGNFRTYHSLGMLFKQLNQLDSAAACFQQFIRLRPQEPGGYLLLASTLKAMGKDSEANQALQRAKGLQSSAQ